MDSEPTTRTEQESLSALRDHVSKAVDEIVRLRAQNTSLARRLSQLESGSDRTAINIAGSTDPEELRTTIGGFIDSIDRYLAAADNDDENDQE